MHVMTYSGLHVTSLDQEWHERTCGYWYTVTAYGNTAHTAFETRAGLDRWLSERGLVLGGELADAGTASSCPVAGAYRTVSHGEHTGRPYPDHMEAGAAWPPSPVIGATAVMSNGAYTLGLITEEQITPGPCPDVLRVIHYLNPNVKTRLVFDRRATDLIMR